jgi:CubicO group peptidase (beta-lactamase class C family)
VHAPDPPHPGRGLRNSGHGERRIQQHIHSGHLHDAIFGPQRLAGHRIIAAEHPGPTGGGKITVRELLQHTSGLHNYTDDLQAQITSPQAYRELEFHQFSRQDLLNVAFSHQPTSAPGTAWNYSDTNYILLGMIIER